MDAKSGGNINSEEGWLKAKIIDLCEMLLLFLLVVSIDFILDYTNFITSALKNNKYTKTKTFITAKTKTMKTSVVINTHLFSTSRSFTLHG